MKLSLLTHHCQRVNSSISLSPTTTTTLTHYTLPHPLPATSPSTNTTTHNTPHSASLTSILDVEHSSQNDRWLSTTLGMCLCGGGDRCSTTLHTHPTPPPPSCRRLSLTNRQSVRQRPIGREGAEIRGTKKQEVKMKTRWAKMRNQNFFWGKHARRCKTQHHLKNAHRCETWKHFRDTHPALLLRH